MQIDGDVEPPGAKPPCPGEIVGPASDAGALRDNQDFVQVRIVLDDRRRERLDEIREACTRLKPPQGPQQRSREDDVANQAQPDDENVHLRFYYEDVHLRFYRRLVNQHHRDIVLDGIHTMALVALERRAVFDQFDRGLAVGAREDFEEFGIDGHPENILPSEVKIV